MRALFTDLLASLSLLSRLPVPVDHGTSATRGAAAAWTWPLVGAVLACLAALPGLALAALGIATPISAGMSLATFMMLTGAMHEDGLADTVDGFWGGWDPERRLEIMKDSRVGVYGVLALVVATGLRWLALTALLTTGPAVFLLGLISASALSRTAMVAVMRVLPNAREGGLAAGVGDVPKSAAYGAAAMVVPLCLIVGPVGGFWAMAATVCMTMAVILIAKAKIGGRTGDTLGATQQVSEIAALTALATILP